MGARADGIGKSLGETEVTARMTLAYSVHRQGRKRTVRAQTRDHFGPRAIRRTGGIREKVGEAFATANPDLSAGRLIR